MKKYLFLLILINQVVCAQTSRKYSNEFLTIGVDAAALAMGKAVVASTNDVTAQYWNSAGLANVNNYQGALMHAEYFAGIAKYDYVGFAMPIDERSVLGISAIRFGVDDILDTTQLIDSEGNIDYNRIQLFSAADYAINLSYARLLNIEGLQIGFNTKIIRRIIGDFANSWGFGIDAGIQYKTPNWMFGFMLRDATTTFNTWSFNEDKFEDIKNAIPGENQELPEENEITIPKAQLGVAKNFELSKNFNLLTEIDFIMSFTETNDVISSDIISVTPALGFQLDYAKIVFLRGGLGNFQNEKQFDETSDVTFEPSLGVGFKYRGLTVDYALTNVGSAGNGTYSNIFSLKLNFDKF